MATYQAQSPGSSLCGSFFALCLMATYQAQSPWVVSLWILLHPLPHGYLPSAEPLVRLSVDPSPPSASWLLTKRRAPGSSLCGSFFALCLMATSQAQMATCQAQSPWVVSLWILLHPLPHGYLPSAEPLGRLSVDPSPPSASWLLAKRRAPGSSLCGSFSTLCLMATSQAQSPWFVSLWILLHPLPHGYLPSAEPLVSLSSLCGSFSTLCLMATSQAPLVRALGFASRLPLQSRLGEPAKLYLYYPGHMGRTVTVCRCHGNTFTNSWSAASSMTLYWIHA